MLAARIIKWIWPNIAILLLLSSFSLCAQLKITVNWTTEVWSKVAEQDGTGAYFDLLNAIYPASDFNLKHTFLPYKRGIQYVREGRQDIFSFCMPVTDLYSAEHPWAQETIGVLFNKKNSALWQGPISLVNKNITLHNNSSLLPTIQSINANWIKTNCRERSLSLLKRQRADYFLGVYINIQQAINSHPEVTMDEFKFEPLNVVTCYPGFTASPKGEKLKQIWDNGIKKLHKSGKLRAIYEKWQLEFPSYQWRKPTTAQPIAVR